LRVLIVVRPVRQLGAGFARSGGILPWRALHVV
jgi:hypothetical protein